MGILASRYSEDYESSEVRHEPVPRVNDSLYELYKPAGTPSVQIIFFHGLQLGNYSQAHLTAWESGDGSCVWPQKWLVEEFPEAHMLSVTCNDSQGNCSPAHVDEHVIGENLMFDLLQANIGQVPSCPVVLVGHSIGGLVIKQVCLHAHEKLHMSRGPEAAMLKKFFDNLKGIFYYSTPHHGLHPVIYRLADRIKNPYFKLLSTDVGRTSSKFDSLRAVHQEWQIAGLGESRPTRTGPFSGMLVVPEASSRGENYNVVEGADHFSISKPASKTSRSFFKLKCFVDDILRSSERRPVERTIPNRTPSVKKVKVEVSSSRKHYKEVQEREDDVDGDAFDWCDDPLTWEKMCDPVMCSDGRTYDRWTILDQKLRRSPYDRSITAFGILCDDITTRSRLFKAFPEQEIKFHQRRKQYREEALRNARSRPLDFENAVDKLSNVLKWLPLDEECQRELYKLDLFKI